MLLSYICGIYSNINIIRKTKNVGIAAISILQMTFATLNHIKGYHKRNRKTYEEQYCDLFAAMYRLPVVFRFNISSEKKVKQFTPNSLSDDDLKELYELNIKYGKAVKDPHPSSLERNYQSFMIAKKMLNNDTDNLIDPSIKKYLQWIVDNFSKTEILDIKNIYNDRVFNPAEADDLDKHLNALISNGKGITVTESDVSWLINVYNDIDMVYCD